MISEEPDILRATGFDTGWDLFKPGRDYKLVPERGTGFPPTYRVWMKDHTGKLFPLEQTLDIRADFQDVRDARNEFSRLGIDEARYSSALMSVLNADPEGPMADVQRRYWDAYLRGQEGDARRIIMQLIDEDYE